MDTNILKFIFSDVSLIALLMSPGMIVSLLSFFIGYKVVKAIGQRYLDIQERQIKIMEEFIFTFTEIKHNISHTKTQSDNLEAILKRISEDIAMIKQELGKLKH